MTPGDIEIIKKKTEGLVSDIIKTGGKNKNSVQLIMSKLYRLGDDLIERTEKKENIFSKIECKTGCSYCCYSLISLTPPEALLIGHHIKENFSLKQTDVLMKRVSRTLRLIRGKSLDEQSALYEKTPCMFLENDKCMVYGARPFICRAWHSLSSYQCERAFQSGDLDAEIDSTPFRGQILGAVRDGLVRACETHGWDSERIDIVGSIKTILSHHSPEESWVKGEKLFQS